MVKIDIFRHTQANLFIKLAFEVHFTWDKLSRYLRKYFSRVKLFANLSKIGENHETLPTKLSPLKVFDERSSHNYTYYNFKMLMRHYWLQCHFVRTANNFSISIHSRFLCWRLNSYLFLLQITQKVLSTCPVTGSNFLKTVVECLLKIAWRLKFLVLYRIDVITSLKWCNSVFIETWFT